MKFEDILEHVGSFGTYQRLLCFILIPLTTGLCGLTYYAQLLILYTPDFYCKQNFTMVNSDNRNSWNESWLWSNVSSVWSKENLFREEFLSCNQLSEESSRFVSSNFTNFDQLTSQECSNGWEYDYSKYFPTVTSQNDWVCEGAWRPYAIVSLFWVGNTIGAWIFGTLSDKFGRRIVICLSMLVYGVAGLASSFSGTNFYAFLCLRFLVGFAHHTLSHLPFILVVEYCGIKSRVIPLLTIMATYTLASILAPFLALFIWDWRTLVVVTSAPNLVLLIFYKWLPESVSWLSTKNRIVPSINQLKKVAEVNGRDVSKELLRRQLVEVSSESSTTENDVDGDDANPSLTSILKYPLLKRNVLVVLMVWMIGCLCYYGHCQNTSNIGENVFRNYILGATIEIPAWSVPYLIQKFGRKNSLIATFILSGASGCFYSFLPTHLENVIFAFALLGRLFITGAYYITLQYGPEIFPTVVRGRGVAMSETLGGIAIFISPLIVYLAEFKLTLPIIVFSSLSLFGGVITTVLPETKGRALPQTLAQAEKFAQSNTTFFTCSKRKGRNRVNTNDEEMETSDTRENLKGIT